jgi:hypothetical protein
VYLIPRPPATMNSPEVRSMRRRQALAAVLLTTAVALPSAADDRDLLRTGTSDPYVFVIFDTSGSMNWTTQCTAADRTIMDRNGDGDTLDPIDQPLCDHVCETKDCWTRFAGDDPNSKFYQAKEALYEVIRDINDINFGFATYNQDGAYMRAKHWLYAYSNFQVNQPIPLAGGGQWPMPGSEEVFGPAYTCASGENDGCWVTQASNGGTLERNSADLANSWERLRAGRIAKALPRTAAQNTAGVFSRVLLGSGGVNYMVQYRPNAVVNNTSTCGGGSDPCDAPSTMQVTIRVEQCGSNEDCRTSQRTLVAERTYNYELLGDFVSWDNGATRGRLDREGGFFDSYNDLTNVSGTCEGWEPNKTTGFVDATTDDDSYTGCNPNVDATCSHKFATTLAPIPDAKDFLVSKGDVLTLDWRSGRENRDETRNRLAPNLTLGEAAPDFRVARYFRNVPETGESFLRLKNATARPLIPSGSTPLGYTIRDFREWYAGCDHGNCPKNSGWRDLAAKYDADFGCRRVYLLVLSDGDETCPGPDACSGTAGLRAQEGIKTYVIGFGVENTSGNRLNCMAANGGTGNPYYPRNKGELVEILNNLFGQIREDVRAFASAAVPSAQAQVADKNFLTTFRPLNAEAVWPGQVDAYLRPLPLTQDGRPDENDACEPGETSGCHLWDASEEMMAQVPSLAEATGGDLRLGMDADERRVFYSAAAAGDDVPRRRRLFQQTAVTAERHDLWRGLGITFVPGDATSESSAATLAQNIIAGTLAYKEGDFEVFGDHDGNPATPPQDYEITLQYILGDIFHSDPILIGNPSNLLYYANRLYDNGQPCDDVSNPNPSYICFSEQHRYRRKVLFVGSNDGQLHAFDAGKFDGEWQGATSTNNLRIVGQFDNGTGREIFSYIPRSVMHKLDGYVNGTKQDWSVDGRVVEADVFIDPAHDGEPEEDEREWRTVVIGGLREGGPSYYALDITQPDVFQDLFLPEPTAGYVPSCSGVTSHDPSVCGTLPYPAVLWEFNDRWDEDFNLRPDLGESWSIVNTGRILVVEDGDLVDKHVVIFGGGMDPQKAAPPTESGNFLYMVDIETGEAIYKRRLDGSAPSEPAAVDTNLDGYIDTIYIGTTAGFLYKADFLVPPVLSEQTIHIDADGNQATVRRLFDSAIEPFKIFDTGGLPIYFPPSVFFIPELTRYALSFGTGDREDLWQFNTQQGLFVTMVDEGFLVSQTGLPKTVAAYEQIVIEGAGQAATNAPGTNYLLNPDAGSARGWYITLEADERMITKTLVISGIVVFTTYTPDIVIVPVEDDDGGGNGNGNGGGGGGPNVQETICARTGTSRVFVVLATNADAIINTAGSTDPERLQRFWEVPDFVTNPYTESGVTKNPGDSGDGEGEGNTEPLTDALKAVNQRLRSLFPDTCKFANPTVDLKTIRSDTGVFFIAPIPVCLQSQGWREL